ncbi:MAG: EAL domain-containing protein [Sulfurimonadaceae bacterium]|nr:EAL domain-containing protein [Sulfurimonadaceae bacterium]
MSKIYVARQEIVNAKGGVFGYELLFRDTKEGIAEFPEHLKATSQVLLNTLTHMDLDEVIGPRGVAFLNADHTVIESNILDILDKDRFVIELLETADLTPKVIEKMKLLKSRGYKIAIDDFDCTAEMVKKFLPVLKYVNLIKIDVVAANPVSLKNVVTKFKKLGIRLLAEKIETEEMYRQCKEMGFDLFQGYAINRPETVEYTKMKDSTSLVILQLITMIKNNDETSEIEAYIKQRPELAYHMIKYINSNAQVVEEISSLTQAITLMGREQLLRWLMVYLYAEVEDNELSNVLLSIALKRALFMEDNVKLSERERAYMVGMFSTLDLLFDAEFEDIFRNLPIESDVFEAIVYKDGELGKLLNMAHKAERSRLKDLLFDNYHLLDLTDILDVLEKAGVDTSRV